jgi:hypothetical protein
MCRLRKYISKGFDTTEDLREDLHARITRELNRLHLEPSQEELKLRESQVCPTCQTYSNAYRLAAARNSIVYLEKITSNNKHIVVLSELDDLITYVSQAEPPMLMGIFANGYRNL